MNDAFARIGWKACTSALRLDRWASGELPAAEAEEVRAHVVACTRCSEAVEVLRAAARAELPPLRISADGMGPLSLALSPGSRPGRGDSVEGPLSLALSSGSRPGRGDFLPPAPVTTPSPPRSGGEGGGEGAGRSLRSRWHVPAAVAGLAAGLAASLVLALRLPSPERAGTGLKGSGFRVSVYVQHGEEVRELGAGGAVSPGDAIRFAVSSPAKAYVAVLSVDPRGNASVYFPLGPRAEPVGPGVGSPLPLGTRLDESLGEERIWALFCAAPIELEPVRARLQLGEDPPVARGCEVIRWHFVKR